MELGKGILDNGTDIWRCSTVLSTSCDTLFAIHGGFRVLCPLPVADVHVPDGSFLPLPSSQL